VGLLLLLVKSKTKVAAYNMHTYSVTSHTPTTHVRMNTQGNQHSTGNCHGNNHLGLSVFTASTRFINHRWSGWPWTRLLLLECRRWCQCAGVVNALLSDCHIGSQMLAWSTLVTEA